MSLISSMHESFANCGISMAFIDNYLENGLAFDEPVDGAFVQDSSSDEDEASDDEGPHEEANPVAEVAPNLGELHLSEQQKVYIISQRVNGESFREIGRRLGISHTTCSRIYQRWVMEESLT
eukprot:gene13281-9515_t